MHPVLEQLRSEIGDGLNGLDAVQSQSRPAREPGKWSIQQVMEHLILTYGSSCDVVDGRVSKRTPTRASPTLMQRAGQFALLQCGYFPRGRTAPPMVTPPAKSEPLSGDALAAKGDDLLMRFDELAAEAERLFGEKRSISHGVLGPLSAAQWRQFHLLHGQHHLRQIRAIRSAHGL